MNGLFSAGTEIILIFAVIIAAFIALVVNFISTIKNYRKQIDDMPDVPEKDELLHEPDAKNAVVLSKRTDGHYEGSHLQPKYINDYYVTFMIDGEKETEYSVFEEAYDRIFVGQSGTLITVNGEFFDFGDGEEITE